MTADPFDATDHARPVRHAWSEQRKLVGTLTSVDDRSRTGDASGRLAPVSSSPAAGGSAADAMLAGEAADQLRYRLLVALGCVRPLAVGLGVGPDQLGVLAAKPGLPPLSRPGAQVQDDRGDVAGSSRSGGRHRCLELVGPVGEVR